MNAGTADPPAEGSERPARRRTLLLLPVLAFAGLAAIFLTRLMPGIDPSAIPSALIGRPAPGFALPALAGLSGPDGPVPGLSSADLKGRVTVVNVWASWCVPCREEHPALMELAREPGLRLVGINQKDPAEDGRRFLARHGNPFAAVGVDATGRASIDWGVYGVPETFIVDADGVVRTKHVGKLTPESLPGFLDKVRAAAARS